MALRGEADLDIHPGRKMIESLKTTTTAAAAR
jgi:hypothetical protein